MKTLLKVLLAAVVINAAARGAMAEWRFYQFEDAVQQEALFSQRRTEEQLAERVVELAEKFEVPVDPDTIAVSYRGAQATVSASYVEAVELVPRVYTRQWPFELNVTVRRLP